MGELELGDEVRDRATGFYGVVADIWVQPSGCCFIGVYSEFSSARPETRYFGEGDIEILQKRRACERRSNGNEQQE